MLKSGRLAIVDIGAFCLSENVSIILGVLDVFRHCFLKPSTWFLCCWIVLNSSSDSSPMACAFSPNLNMALSCRSRSLYSDLDVSIL